MNSYLKNMVCVPSIILLALTSCASSDWFSDDYDDYESYSASTGVYKVGTPYQVAGVWYYPSEDYTYIEDGVASWYGPDFHNGITANGETYDMYAMTAAHRTLPLPSVVEVTNLENGRSLVLRVNDRGPFVNNRIIDVSKAAAEELDFHTQGTTHVRVRILPEESMRLKRAMLGGQPYYPSGNKPSATAAAPNNIYTNNGYYTGEMQSNSAHASYQANNTSGIKSITKPQVRVINNAAEGTTVTSKPLSEEEPLIAIKKEVKKEITANGKKLTTSTTSYKEAKKFTPQVPVEAVPESGMYIQAGAFSSMKNAQNLSLKLKKYGPAVVNPSEVNGKAVYRVRIGPFLTAKDALDTLDKMKVYGYKDARIIQEKVVKRTITKSIKIDKEIGSDLDKEL